jgi:hypothetical protein
VAERVVEKLPRLLGLPGSLGVAAGVDPEIPQEDAAQQPPTGAPQHRKRRVANGLSLGAPHDNGQAVERDPQQESAHAPPEDVPNLGPVHPVAGGDPAAGVHETGVERGPEEDGEKRRPEPRGDAAPVEEMPQEPAPEDAPAADDAPPAVAVTGRNGVSFTI